VRRDAPLTGSGDGCRVTVVTKMGDVAHTFGTLGFAAIAEL
jgi:hypothetical protein